MTRSHALTLVIAVGLVVAWLYPGVGAVAALALWWLVGSVYSRKGKRR
jgi:hypothetical protein